MLDITDLRLGLIIYVCICGFSGLFSLLKTNEIYCMYYLDMHTNYLKNYSQYQMYILLNIKYSLGQKKSHVNSNLRDYLFLHTVKKLLVWPFIL